MKRHLPDGWRILSTDYDKGREDAQKSAARVAALYPILPIWTKEMMVRDKMEDFAPAEWDEMLKKILRNPIPDGQWVRLYDACSIDDQSHFLQWDSVSLYRGNGSWKVNISTSFDYPKEWFLQNKLAGTNGIQLDESNNPRFPQPVGGDKRFYFERKTAAYGAPSRIYFCIPTKPFEIEEQMQKFRQDSLFRRIVELDGSSFSEQEEELRRLLLNDPQRTFLNIRLDLSDSDLAEVGKSAIINTMREVRPIAEAIKTALTLGRNLSTQNTAILRQTIVTTANGFLSKGPVVEYFVRKRSK